MILKKLLTKLSITEDIFSISISKIVQYRAILTFFDFRNSGNRYSKYTYTTTKNKPEPYEKCR